MNLTRMISQSAILPHLNANSKKKVLQVLSERVASIIDIPERDIFDTLSQREKLGSTGIGHGVAIPHGKLAGLDHMFALFASLQTPIEFDTADAVPVDLIFLILAPEHSDVHHLKLLAHVTRILRDADLLDKLRTSNDPTTIQALLQEKISVNTD